MSHNPIGLHGLSQGQLFFFVARGNVVVKALCYKGKVTGSILDVVISLIYLILLDALGPGVYSASNRNEYQKH
jgi:hypothetical protein